MMQNEGKWCVGSCEIVVDPQALISSRDEGSQQKYDGRLSGTEDMQKPLFIFIAFNL